MKTNLFHFSHGTKGVTPAHPLQAFIGSISVVDTTHRVFLFFSLLLFLGIAPQAWADVSWYDLTNTNTIYFDNSKSNYDNVSLLIGRDYKYGDSDGVGSKAKPLSHITNTDLYWRSQGAFAHFNHFLFVKGNWDDGDNWNNDKPWDRANYSGNINTLDNNHSLSGGYHLFTAASGNDDAALSYEYQSDYTNLNKHQTVKVMISTDGGSTYSEAKTNWYDNSISATRYTLTDYKTAEQSPKTLARTENYASAVITSSITFTATADDNFTFAGWATNDQGPDDTNASYSYTVSGTQTIYAYFKENTSTITLEGCTASSTTAGPITTGTATAKEPAGKVVTGFIKSGNEITFTGAMADKAITFNATAAGTVTAQFAYKTPTIEVASKATYTLGGAAIKLNPKYTDLAADATYAWTGANVTFSDATAANPNISVATAGEYTITITVTQGDKHSSQNITLTATDFTGDDCGTCFQYTAQ